MTTLNKYRIHHNGKKTDIHAKTFFDANAMYIDTTAYGNNKLSAVIIQNNNCIEIIEVNSVMEDINKNWIYQF